MLSDDHAVGFDPRLKQTMKSSENLQQDVQNASNSPAQSKEQRHPMVDRPLLVINKKKKKADERECPLFTRRRLQANGPRKRRASGRATAAQWRADAPRCAIDRPPRPPFRLPPLVFFCGKRRGTNEKEKLVNGDGVRSMNREAAYELRKRIGKRADAFRSQFSSFNPLTIASFPRLSVCRVYSFVQFASKRMSQCRRGIRAEWSARRR